MHILDEKQFLRNKREIELEVHASRNFLRTMNVYCKSGDKGG
jgi:hypothetical protein